MGSVTNIETRRAPEDDRLSRTFMGADDFSALRQAESYLEARGFSYGVMQGACPIGVELGDVNIGKWRGLSPEEQNDLAGQITSENFRKGPVTISIRPDAPARVIEAFTADVEEPSNVVPLRGAEVADAQPVIDPPGVFIDDSSPKHVRVSRGFDAMAQSFVENGGRRLALKSVPADKEKA